MNALIQKLDAFNTATQQMFTLMEQTNDALAQAGYVNFQVQNNYYAQGEWVWLVASKPVHTNFPLNKETFDILGQGLPESEVYEKLKANKDRDFAADKKESLLQRKGDVVLAPMPSDPKERADWKANNFAFNYGQSGGSFLSSDKSLTENLYENLHIPTIKCKVCDNSVPHSVAQHRAGEITEICPTCRDQDIKDTEMHDNIFDM